MNKSEIFYGMVNLHAHEKQGQFNTCLGPQLYHLWGPYVAVNPEVTVGIELCKNLHNKYSPRKYEIYISSSGPRQFSHFFSVYYHVSSKGDGFGPHY